MKLLRYILPVMLAVGFTSGVLNAEPGDSDSKRDTFDPGNDRGDHGDYNRELTERDWEVLRDYLNTKRTINLYEKSCNLTIAGDVRTDWRHQNEKRNGHNIRGSDNKVTGTYIGPRVSRNDFDIEFNLYFDYVCDRAWAVAHLQFDNTAGVMGGKNNQCLVNTDDTGTPSHTGTDDGISDEDYYVVDLGGWKGSGECDDLCLKKAYIGYNICCCGDTRFDVELGRRRLYNVFDSEVQFLSQFDGLLLKYISSWDCVADWYLYVGGFVIDERSNHFGWVTEAGFLNICNSGIDFKYSFIDWKKRGSNRCGGASDETIANRNDARNPLGFAYQISQFTLKYHFDPEMLCVPAYFYSAFLVNHGSRGELPCGTLVDDYENKTVTYDIGRKNLAWYAGMRFGEVVYCGDWAFDLQYQYVQALAIPDKDVSGIGRGNVRDDSITDGGMRGNTNYKGWRLEALYAVTDNLTLDALIEASRQINKNIGGRHRHSMLKVEAIYAF